MCDHSPNREAAMVPITGTPVPGVTTKVGSCDPCLLPLIQALNDGGQYTIASCCGHGRRPGRITLADDRELFLVPDYETASMVADLLPFPGINDEPHVWPEVERVLAALGTGPATPEVAALRVKVRAALRQARAGAPAGEQQ